MTFDDGLIEDDDLSGWPDQAGSLPPEWHERVGLIGAADTVGCGGHTATGHHQPTPGGRIG